MRKTKFLLTFIVTTVVLSGCINTQLPDDYSVEPNPLEVHGNKVEVKVSGTIPEKSFHKKAVVEFTPVLRYDNNAQKLESITLRGEDAPGNGKVINSKTGGKVEYSDVVDWDPGMKQAELVVTATVTKKDKTETFPDIKVADGVIATSRRVGKAGEPAMAEHGYEKETIITESGNIYFAYNRSNLNWSLDLNKDNEEIQSLKDFMEKGWKVKQINVDAWASPEGELSLNEELSNERAETAKDFLAKSYKKMSRNDDNQVNYKDVEKEINFMVKARGEDYDGFMKALQESNIDQKNTISNVIKSQATKREREQRIEDMTVIYKEVEQMLEVLRRAEITVHAFEPKRSDENIAELSTTHPDSLKQEELLYAATLTDDHSTQLNIYESAIKAYPKSWEAYNNAAAVLLSMGEEDKAAKYLEQANTLNPNNGVIANNLGVLAAWKRDFKSAANYYSTASAKGINTSFNEATLKIINGDYQGALAAYENTNCEYNKALTLLMLDKTNEATKVLDCAPETFQTRYLMAVIGARTNNDNMLYTNLKKSISLNPDCKMEAAVDREFIDYFDKDEFKEIVQ